MDQETMSSRNRAHCGLADRVPSICVALSQCIAGTGGKSPNQDTQSDKTLQNTSNLTAIAANHIGYAALSRQSFLLLVHIKFYTSTYSGATSTFNEPRHPRRANTEFFAMLERCWASNWRARNQRDDRRNIPSTQALCLSQTRGVNSSTLPSPPPPPARLYARFVLTLWLEKCLIQRRWCGHVAQPDKVWEQQRRETILEKKPQQQFICLKLSPPHVHGAASVPHTSARTGQALHSAGHKATNIFCSLKPALISI